MSDNKETKPAVEESICGSASDALNGARMPSGDVVTNVYEAYESGRRAASADLKQAPTIEEGARDERVAFEKWFSDDGQFPRAIERVGDGYRLSTAQQAWEAWQACSAALGRASAPEETTYEECMASMLDRMEAAEADAFRYRYLRERPLDAIDKGGIFAGRTPDNVVLNGDDLDRAIDAEMNFESKGA